MSRPAWYQTGASRRAQDARREGTICRTPDCGTRREDGFRFCAPCLVRLHRIRDELEREAVAKRATEGGRRGSTCCTIGCLNRRSPSKSLCVECEVLAEQGLLEAA